MRLSGLFPGKREEKYVAHMNASLEPGASSRTPLTLEHVHVAVRTSLIVTPGSFLTWFI